MLQIMVLKQFHNKGYFFLGPNLKNACESGSMVTSANGEWIRLLGCHSSNKIDEKDAKIYDLQDLKEWKIYPKKLSHPKYQGLALNAPDDFCDLQ